MEKLTIDDAIIHCNEKSKGCSECNEQHKQLANWLEELKNYKKLAVDTDKINLVTVRWNDGYLEPFRATEVRFGSDLLWMRLEDGNNRHIPLRQVRWFGTSIESHQSTEM